MCVSCGYELVSEADIARLKIFISYAGTGLTPQRQIKNLCTRLHFGY